MKIMLISILISIRALAAAPTFMDIKCVTEVPTTSFIGETIKGELKLSLINHFGNAAMPMHSGIVTINDMGILSQRAEALKVVGNRAEFSIPLSACEKYKDGTFLCLGGSEFQGAGGKVIGVSSLSAVKTKTTFADYSFEQILVRLSLKIDGQDYSVPMAFSPEECPIDLK